MKPTQEQVIAWAREAGYLPDGFGFGAWDMKEFNEAIALAYEAGRKDERDSLLYTAPPQREWQGMTDEEIQQIEMSASSKLSAIYLAEAQLKGKNAL